MNAFKSFVGGLKKDQGKNEEAVAILLERLSDSVIIDDRRSALRELSSILARDEASRSELASTGFKTICIVLQKDSDDPISTKLCLECLSVVLNGNAFPGSDSKGARLAIVNSEQFVRTEGSVHLLASLLDSTVSKGLEGYHIKKLILQMLYGLLGGNSVAVKQSIIEAPLIISRISSILKDQEELKYYSVLILEKLVQGSSKAQQEAAEVGVLECLSSIIKSEGWMLGGDIVGASLDLIRAITYENYLSTSILRQTNFLCELEQMLIEKEGEALQSNPHASFSQSRNRNVSSALKLLQSHCHQSPTLRFWRTVAVLAVHEGVSSEVHAVAFGCLITLRSNYPQEFENYIQGRKVGLARMVLKSAMLCDGSAEQMNAIVLFHILCESNEMQLEIVQIIKADADNERGILQALYKNSDLSQTRIGSIVALLIASLIIDNLDTKQSLYLFKLPRNKETLLDISSKQLAKCITIYGGLEEGPRSAVYYSLMLIFFLQTFPPAVDAFLYAIQHQPFLLGVLQVEGQFGAANVDIQGSCAVLLGLCCIYATPSAVVAPGTLLQAVASQLTFPTYFKRISDFLTSVQTGKSLIPSYFSHHLEDIIKEVKVEMSRAGNFQLEDEMTTRESMEKLQTKQEVNAAEEHSISNKSCSQNANGTIDGYSKRNENSNEQFSEQNIELEKIKLYCKELELKLSESKESEQNLRSALSKVEADLEGLSREYASLDAHANDLNAQIVALQSALSAKDVFNADNKEMSKEDDIDVEELLVCLGQEEEKGNFLRGLCEKHGIHIPEKYT